MTDSITLTKEQYIEWYNNKEVFDASFDSLKAFVEKPKRRELKLVRQAQPYGDLWVENYKGTCFKEVLPGDILMTNDEAQKLVKDAVQAWFDNNNSDMEKILLKALGLT